MPTSLTLEPYGVVDDLQSVSHRVVLADLHLSAVCGEQEAVASQLGLPGLGLGFSRALALLSGISLPLTPTPARITKPVAGLGWNLSRVVHPLLSTPKMGAPFSPRKLHLITPPSCSVGGTLPSDFHLLGWLDLRAAWTISPSSQDNAGAHPLGAGPQLPEL